MAERKFIIADPQKCNGCGVCELVCSASKDKTFNRRTSRIKVVNIEPTVDIALACRLCEEPPCVGACTRKALKQDEETGVILVDENKCNGCGWCIEVCDYGVLIYDSHRKAMIVCDLCEGDPLCVKYCVQEALELTTMEKIAEKTRKSTVGKLFQSLTI